MFSRTCLFLLFCLTTLAPGVCAAQASPPPPRADSTREISPSLLKEAERLWKEGIGIARKGQYKKALSKFWASYRLVPNSSKYRTLRASLHFFIGFTYQKIRKWQQARDHYRWYLGLQPKGRYKKKIGIWLKEIYPHIRAKLSLQGAANVSCELRHPGGQWNGSLPTTLDLEAGTLFLECQAPSFLPYRRKLSLRPKQTITHEVALKPKPRPAPPRMTPNLRWIGLVVGGVGVASLGAGGLLGGLAAGDQKLALENRDKKTPEASQEALNYNAQAQQKATLANVFYAVGGGLVLTGVILYLVLGPRRLPPGKSSPGPKKQAIHLYGFTDAAPPQVTQHKNHTAKPHSLSVPVQLYP